MAALSLYALVVTGSIVTSSIVTLPPIGESVLYVHVGKCGGTYIHEWLQEAQVNRAPGRRPVPPRAPRAGNRRRLPHRLLPRQSRLQVPHAQIHMGRPSVDDTQYSRYVIWVRDPVERFRSAYDFSRAVITTNITGWSRQNFKQNCPGISSTCLVPGKILRKLETGHVYSEEYEQLILHFKDANEVAEALSTCTSKSAEERANCELAWRLMHQPEEHINKGVGYYLYDGLFIERHADRIFVGTLERLDEDLDRLARWLNLGTRPSPPPLRVSPPSMRQFSDVAQANIRAYYNKSGPIFRNGRGYVSADYEAMRGLVRAGLLRADQYDLMW
jgi:hypothetical protein